MSLTTLVGGIGNFISGFFARDYQSQSWAVEKDVFETLSIQEYMQSMEYIARDEQLAEDVAARQGKLNDLNKENAELAGVGAKLNAIKEEKAKTASVANKDVQLKKLREKLAENDVRSDPLYGKPLLG